MACCCLKLEVGSLTCWHLYRLFLRICVGTLVQTLYYRHTEHTLRMSHLVTPKSLKMFLSPPLFLNKYLYYKQIIYNFNFNNVNKCLRFSFFNNVINYSKYNYKFVVTLIQPIRYSIINSTRTSIFCETK